MGIGGSKLSKKDLNELKKIHSTLKTKLQKLKWFSEGEIDVMKLSRLKDMKPFYYPLINGFRLTGEDGKALKAPDYDKAMLIAIHQKGEILKKYKAELRKENKAKK